MGVDGAVRDFGGLQGVRSGASPSRATTDETTKQAAKRSTGVLCLLPLFGVSATIFLFNAATGICEMASSRSVERSDTTDNSSQKIGTTPEESQKKEPQRGSILQPRVG